MARTRLLLAILCLMQVSLHIFLANAQDSHSHFRRLEDASPKKSFAEGFCSMYGICARRTDGKVLNCPSNTPAVKPDKVLSSKVQSLCPMITDSVCCTADQFDTLHGQVQQAIPLLVGCPACLRNFLNLFCELSCSPNQSLFINVTSVKKTSNTTTVDAIDVYITNTYGEKLYNSCKDVKFGTMNTRAMDFVGGGANNYKEWLAFMGRQAGVGQIGSPYAIDFWSNIPDPSAMKPLNVTVYSCGDPSLGCSCGDCTSSSVCSKSAQPALHKKGSCNIKMGSLEVKCLELSLAVVYIVFISAFLLWGLLHRKKVKDGPSSRTNPLSNAKDEKDLQTVNKPDNSIHTTQIHASPPVAQSTIRPSPVQRCMSSFFRKYGTFVSRKPKLVLCLSVAIPLLLCIGLVRFKVETRPEKIWVGPGSRAAEEKKYFDEHLAPFYRIEQLILSTVPVSKDDNSPRIVTDKNMKLLFEIQHKIDGLKANYSGSMISLTDICLKPLGNDCATQSVLQYFKMDPENYDSYGGVGHAEYCFAHYSSEETCLSAFQAPLDPSTALGGFPGSNYSEASAFVITYPVNNEVDRTGNENGKAVAWEKAFVRLVKEELTPMVKLQNLTLSFSSESSVQEELKRESTADVITILVSYLVMFAYISFTLGDPPHLSSSLFVSTKVLLGLAGVLVVVLSVLGSVGFFSAIGVKSTLIIMEVIPFLVLAVQEIVLSNKFWDNVDLALKVFTPLVKVLRRVDGDKVPSMGFVYGDLVETKVEIASALAQKEKMYLPIWKIIDKRWDEKLKSPLHRTGYYLNPFYYYPNKEAIEKGNIFDGFVECMHLMYGNDHDIIEKIGEQLYLYQNQKGSFGRDFAKNAAKNPKINPVTWWSFYGTDAPELKQMALRVLNFATSSSGCERNWSTFEMVGVDNMCILVHAVKRQSPELSLEGRVSNALVEVGPSITLASLSEVLAFAVGSFIPMPACRAFSMFAALAVLLDFLLQVTVFVALIVLDFLRVEDNRIDCFPCIKVSSSNGSDKGDDQRNLGLIAWYMKDVHAPLLDIPGVKIIVIAVFIMFSFASIDLCTRLQPGLEQQIALPRDSYLQDYFEDLAKYLRVGPPLYFVVKEFNYSLESQQTNQLCSISQCNSNSLLNEITQASLAADSSYIAKPAASWLDDFLIWLSPEAFSCCRKFINGSYCPPDDQPPCCQPGDGSCGVDGICKDCTTCFRHSDLYNGRPSTMQFKEKLPWFLKALPSSNCAKGGNGAYTSSVELTGYESGIIQASSFRTYHTPLNKQSDYVNGMRAAREFSSKVSKSLKMQIFPYSVFYIFFEQYIDIWKTALINMSIVLGAIFIVCLVITSSLWTSSIILVVLAMIVTDMMGVMAILKIQLNAISIVNLVMSIGIAVEFCVHITHSFSVSSGDRGTRAKTALTTMGASVFSGITLTKLVGVIVLRFARSEVFVVYYFQMYLALVLLGFLHGLVFLPVVLSICGPPSRHVPVERQDSDPQTSSQLS